MSIAWWEWIIMLQTTTSTYFKAYHGENDAGGASRL